MPATISTIVAGTAASYRIAGTAASHRYVDHDLVEIRYQAFTE